MVLILRPIVTFVALTCVIALPLLAVIVVAYVPPTLTPNDTFFNVSIDGTPDISTDTWNLSIKGSVNHPLTYTFASITSLPNVTEVARLQCVDGPSGLAAWTGVPLNTILSAAGVQKGAERVVFYGADGYSSSLALPTENTSDVLLAWYMNGVPLPPAQGFPLRVAAPNALGYQWVKWVTKIN